MRRDVRLPVLVLVWLGIGAVISIGVGWGFALHGQWSPPPRWRVFAPPRDEWPFARLYPSPPTLRERETGIGFVHELAEWWIVESRYERLAITCTGFPCACVRSTEKVVQVYGPNVPSSLSRSLSDCWEIHRPPKTWRLSLRLMWPGFAINTMLYGLLAWGMVRGIFGYRSRRRRRAGRCVKCGYDMRGLAAGATCPECGAAVR